MLHLVVKAISVSPTQLCVSIFLLFCCLTWVVFATLLLSYSFYLKSFDKIEEKLCKEILFQSTGYERDQVIESILIKIYTFKHFLVIYRIVEAKLACGLKK